MKPLHIHSRLRLARVRAAKAVRLLMTPAHWTAVRAGVVPTVEHTAVPLGGPYATVLDVGASRGQFALHARHRFPRADVLCFEPLPASQARIRRVLGDAVQLLPVAVGETEGTARMHVSAADDSSSLLPIGRLQQREFPGTHEHSQLDVPVITLRPLLESHLARPVLLKIDVQGFELGVLRGAGEALKSVDTIFVECSFVELYDGQALADEVIVYLAEMGFHLAGVFGVVTSQSGDALQADLLFRRETPVRTVPSAS